MNENEKKFVKLITEISLKNNYEHLHPNLIVHKSGLRELKNIIDGALEDYDEGRIDNTNAIIKAYNYNRDNYNEWLEVVSLYFVGTKKPTSADIRTAITMYIEQGLLGEKLPDDLVRYVRLSFNDYITGEAKTLDHAFKITGTGKGYDHNDPRNLPDDRTYKWVRDMTEYIIDEDKSMKQALEKIQGIEAKSGDGDEPDKNALVDNFNLYKWFALNDYLFEKLTSYDNTLSDEQIDKIANNYWKVRLPCELKQDLWFKLGDKVVRKSQIKGMTANAEVIKAKDVK